MIRAGREPLRGSLAGRKRLTRKVNDLSHLYFQPRDSHRQTLISWVESAKKKFMQLNDSWITNFLRINYNLLLRIFQNSLCYTHVDPTLKIQFTTNSFYGLPTQCSIWNQDFQRNREFRTRNQKRAGAHFWKGSAIRLTKAKKNG